MEREKGEEEKRKDHIPDEIRGIMERVQKIEKQVDDLKKNQKTLQDACHTMYELQRRRERTL